MRTLQPGEATRGHFIAGENFSRRRLQMARPEKEGKDATTPKISSSTYDWGKSSRRSSGGAKRQMRTARADRGASPAKHKIRGSTGRGEDSSQGDNIVRFPARKLKSQPNEPGNKAGGRERNIRRRKGGRREDCGNREKTSRVSRSPG